MSSSSPVTVAQRIVIPETGTATAHWKQLIEVRLFSAKLRDFN
jgi:hypothetical protein